MLYICILRKVSVKPVNYCKIQVQLNSANQYVFHNTDLPFSHFLYRSVQRKYFLRKFALLSHRRLNLIVFNHSSQIDSELFLNYLYSYEIYGLSISIDTVLYIKYKENKHKTYYYSNAYVYSMFYVSYVIILRYFTF